MTQQNIAFARHLGTTSRQLIEARRGADHFYAVTRFLARLIGQQSRTARRAAADRNEVYIGL